MPRFGLFEMSVVPLNALFMFMALVVVELADEIAEDETLGVGPPGAAHDGGTGLNDPNS